MRRTSSHCLRGRPRVFGPTQVVQRGVAQKMAPTMVAKLRSPWHGFAQGRLGEDCHLCP